MKKILPLVIIILLISNFSKAQLLPNKGFLGAYAGASMYTAYGSYNSFTFGAEFGHNINKDVSFLVNAGAIVESGGKRYDITINTRAYISNETSVKFFGELGAGPYIFKSSSYYSTSETYMGLNFGIGGRIPVDKQTDLVIKGKFHNVFPSGGYGLNWVNLTFGINFNL